MSIERLTSQMTTSRGLRIFLVLRASSMMVPPYFMFFGASCGGHRSWMPLRDTRTAGSPALPAFGDDEDRAGDLASSPRPGTD